MGKDEREYINGGYISPSRNRGRSRSRSRSEHQRNYTSTNGRRSLELRDGRRNYDESRSRSRSRSYSQQYRHDYTSTNGWRPLEPRDDRRDYDESRSRSRSRSYSRSGSRLHSSYPKYLNPDDDSSLSLEPRDDGYNGNGFKSIGYEKVQVEDKDSKEFKPIKFMTQLDPEQKLKNFLEENSIPKSLLILFPYYEEAKELITSIKSRDLSGKKQDSWENAKKNT